ncbi:HEAT repeat-containing protein 3-like [Oppia nitens]|uniref:HEAT repeat-containing protein 3-like n=1 Tax=Oppia nitens TaxID=1686743 RepID=UPI0023D9CE8C|nr:HEAT repeat-containing protein 3-like [Oppia nitens]
MGKSKSSRSRSRTKLRQQSWPSIPQSMAAAVAAAAADEDKQLINIHGYGGGGGGGGSVGGDGSGQLLAEIRQKLVSSKPADRHFGANMIVQSMTNFDNYTDTELKQLVRTLSPLCLDRAENCRNAATDSLCYLSSLSDRLCDLMVAADVMTPIAELFGQHFAATDYWTKQDNNTNGSRHLSRQLSDQIYINCCRLVANLCCTSVKAIDIFNKSAKLLTQILVNGLRAVVDPSISEVAIASAQCISVVSEDNRLPELYVTENVDFIRQLMQCPTATTTTVGDNSSTTLYLAVLCAQIAYNMTTTTTTAATIDDTSPALDVIFAVIDNVLSRPCHTDITDLATNIQQFLDTNKDIDNLRDNYRNVKNLILAKRSALELIANIIGGSGDDEAVDDDEDMDYSDCDDDGIDDDDVVVESGDIDDVDDDNKRLASGLSPKIESMIVAMGLIDKIGQHLCPLDRQLSDKLSATGFGTEIVECIQTIQLCSMTCLHNLVDCMSKQFSRTSLLNEQIWRYIYSIVFGDNNTHQNDIPVHQQCNQQLLEESVNTMRALVAGNQQLSLSVSDLDKLWANCLRLQQWTTGDGCSMAYKINVINLMSLCGQRSEDIGFIERLTELLLSGLVSAAGDLVVRAELIDALIDMHSEDHKTDPVLIKLNLISRLKSAALVFRKEVNNSRSAKSSPIVSTVHMNVMPFIKYNYY